MKQAGFGGDVGEGAVAIVFEEMIGGFLPGGETFEAGAVDEKNVQPAVVVVIVERDAAAGGFEKIFIFVLAAENGFGVEAGFARDVEKGNAKIVVGGGGARLWRNVALRKESRQPLLRERQGENFLQREHDGGTAKGLEKRAACKRQKYRYLSLRAPC